MGKSRESGWCQPGEFNGRPILKQDRSSSPEPHWHSRGYIPHFDSPGSIQHVTFHLADSLPKAVLDRFEDEIRDLPESEQEVERYRRIEAWIDAGHGCCLLRDPRAAQLTQDALLHFDGVRYHLLGWAVMPNHVHVLFEQMKGWKLSGVVTAWKSYTGRRLMPKLRALPGMGSARHVWYREYRDRYVRDQRHFQAVMAYIHNNPVAARLCDTPEAWPWSSARLYLQDDLSEDNTGSARLQPGEASEE